jgi:hypothetical protein
MPGDGRAGEGIDHHPSRPNSSSLDPVIAVILLVSYYDIQRHV